MIGRPPFHLGKWVCLCMCVYVIVSMYICGETARVVPSPTVLCCNFPVHFDEMKKEKSYS
jgi:hypothetical protein